MFEQSGAQRARVASVGGLPTASFREHLGSRAAVSLAGVVLAVATVDCGSQGQRDAQQSRAGNAGASAMTGSPGAGDGGRITSDGAASGRGGSSVFGSGGTAAMAGSSGGRDGGGEGGSAAGGMAAGGSSASAGGGGDGGSGASSFVHPGVLHTRAELDRIIEKVDAGAQPWTAGWERLTSSSYAQTGYTPNPQAIVCAGSGGCPDGETFMPLARDAAAAYQNALRYQISGDTKHADKGVEILDAWSSTLQSIKGDSNAGLRAGLYGYQLAAAAELLRDYPGWARGDFERLKTLLLTKFYPISSDFLKRHNGTCFDHYWANWDVSNMTTILAIGVLSDDRAKFDEAVNYFKHGSGTGQVDRLITHLYPGNPALGQGQESGRDQGHMTLVISLVGAFAKIAYDQGEDLFGYADNAILALAEYTAKYNLGQDVPWTNYTNCEGNAMTSISATGRGTLRPSWELLYNHYVKSRGLNAPSVQQFAEMVRPEGGGGQYGPNSGGFDQLGFGTLTFSVE